VPVEPPPSPWDLPPATVADEHGVVGIGGDLEPGTLLAAYRSALFPMPLHRGGPLAWWSPDPRAVIPLDGLHVSRSLRKSCRRFEIRIDTAFDEVIASCADRRRPHGWISREIVNAYTELHRLGWAHSVETWTNEPTPRLVGGLYGVAIGGLFAGESMFHRETDASKVALVGLVNRLRADGRHGRGRLLDVQWLTPHLASLGAVTVPVRRYLELLERARRLPLPEAFESARRR
jgi:leucyl/phenylalanyl-tRNA---protein transferase